MLARMPPKHLMILDIPLMPRSS
ncbi:hypothetical protein YQE_02305, partial [Dendroctonus ponderosae]